MITVASQAWKDHDADLPAFELASNSGDVVTTSYVGLSGSRGASKYMMGLAQKNALEFLRTYCLAGLLSTLKRFICGFYFNIIQRVAANLGIPRETCRNPCTSILGP